MKAIKITGLMTLFFLISGSIAAYSQDSQAEVPGDNFSLEGALNLFKKSTSPEDFERLLNSPDSQVNNLDLNGDGEIDYIRVTDRTDGNVHDFILQDLVSDNEVQDIAVIELTKGADGSATLQITGDANIYGVQTIIEPSQEVQVYAGTTTAREPVNVWVWPTVRYIYSPAYVVYASPWSWSYRPYWWHTWRPVDYYVYYGWSQPWHSYYSVCYTQRNPYAYYHVYRPYRHESQFVYDRHHDEIAHYRNDHHDEGHHYGYAHNDGYSGNGYDHSGRDRGTGSTYNHSGYNSHGGNAHGDHSGNTGTSMGGNSHGNNPNTGQSSGSPGNSQHRDRSVATDNQGNSHDANYFNKRYSNSSLSSASSSSTQWNSRVNRGSTPSSSASPSRSFSNVGHSTSNDRFSSQHSSQGLGNSHAPQRVSAPASAPSHGGSSGRSRGR